jgi:hypothetical protein
MYTYIHTHTYTYMQEDFIEIKQQGFNSVEGVQDQGIEIAPFVGGGAKHIDNAVS